MALPLPSAAQPSKSARLCAVLGLFALGAVSLYQAWKHYYPVQIAASWSFSVYRGDIPMVSALAVDKQGNLYVSQEFNHGRGVIFRLTPDGARQDILTGLSKPDGMTPYRDGIVASQEGGEQPVLWWKDGRTETLFIDDNVEGLASDGRNLFAVEDLKRGGHLLKYDLETKEMAFLRDDLEESEGVAVCPDGRLLYTEKKKGWIKRFRPGNNDEIIVRGLRDPGFVMCNGDELWITEDLTHHARLLRLDASGKLETILSHLRSPQTVVALTPTRFLVAEQGRGRILELNLLSNAKP